MLHGDNEFPRAGRPGERSTAWPCDSYWGGISEPGGLHRHPRAGPAHEATFQPLTVPKPGRTRGRAGRRGWRKRVRAVWSGCG